MSDVAACPFAAGDRGVDEPDPVRSAMRAAGPLVRAEAPAGGPAWIVTDGELARAVLTDARISKDTGFAPESWGDPRQCGLEPPAAVQPALTSLEGEAHNRLRQAHAPMFSARRMAEAHGRMAEIARELLADVAAAAAVSGPVDLTADFTTRYPLTVLCDLLGVPREHVDLAMAACRGMFSQDPAEVGAAMGAFARLAAAALATGSGIATELAGRMPEGMSRDDLHYQIFALLFAGQLTTDPAVGFLVARVLGSGDDQQDPESLVREVLRAHPPAPLSLWRFTTVDMELAGVSLPARTPVLVDIEGVNTAGTDHDLTFGGGPHYCTGARLAVHELRALVEVLREDYPDARVTTAHADLRQVVAEGINGGRLAALPVSLR